ncbi:MAG: endonuclease/exonuclease/phosphatase family protein [Ginsengibacter sp.]
MIYKFIVICSLWFCIGCGHNMSPSSVKATGDTSSILRVLTYNIHHASPPSKPGLIDIDAIANVITKQQPDLIALQEVDVNTSRSGKTINEAAEIAKKTGMEHYFFAKAIDYDGGEYGVAILSKFPLEQKMINKLPTEESTGGEHRILATTVVQLPNGKKIIFACTHLDAQKKDTNRILQINKIIELIRAASAQPIIIAGDFNATPGSNTINTLDKSFTRTCVSCGFTIPSVNPTKTIDFIGYRPFGVFTVKKHEVVNEGYASDHLPVFAILEIR